MPYRGNNYSFVVDSSFRPFTFQEMLAPYAIYKEEADKTEAALDALNAKAGSLKVYMDSLPEGSRAKDTFNKYYNDLDASAKDFGKSGLSMSNKRALLDLKRRYAGEIGKIEAANTIRQAQIKEQHDIELKDPTMMFSREAKFSDIDDYLDNPNISYKSYSGALLATQVNDAATKIAKSLVDYVNGKPLDGNTRTWIQKHGLTALEVAQAISNPNSMAGSKVLSTLMNSVMESSGIPRWADPITLKKAYYWASQGLWSAIGEDKVGTYKLPIERQGRAAASTNTATESSTLPPLLTGITSRGSSTSATASGGTRKNASGSGRLYGRNNMFPSKSNKKAYGGNLFAPGGPTDDNTPQTQQPAETPSLSPQLEGMLNQMSDSDYYNFVTDLVGKKDITAEQADSALSVFNKQMIESMEDNYIKHLEDEGYADVNDMTPFYEPQNVATTLEANQMAEDLKMLKTYGKYFYKTKTGAYALNAAGRKLYSADSSEEKRSMYSPSAGTMVYLPPSRIGSFRRWIDSRGLSEMAHGKTGKYQSEIFEGIKTRAAKKWDATLATEYYGMLDSDQDKDLMQRLWRIADNGTLPRFERVKQNGSYVFKEKGKPIKVKDIESNMKSAAVVFGKHGNYLEVTTDGGKVYVPFEMLSSIYDPIVTANVTKAEALQKMKKAGTKVGTKNKGKEVESVEQARTRALNAALYNMISAFSTFKTKPREVVRNIYRPKND